MSNPRESGNGTVLRIRHVTFFVAFLAGVTTLFGVLHTQVFLPSVLASAMELTDKKIEAAIEIHERGTHERSATVREFETLRSDIRSLNDRISKIDDRLTRVLSRGRCSDGR